VCAADDPRRVAPEDLRVRRIIDLHPGRAVGLIHTVRPLRDDPLEIPLTRHPEQMAAPLRNAVVEEHAAFDLRHDRSKPALASDQWYPPTGHVRSALAHRTRRSAASRDGTAAG